MSAQSVRSEKLKDYVRLLQNPYASLSFVEQPDDAPSSVSSEQRRNYFRKLENPHAFDAIFGEPAPVELVQTRKKSKAILSDSLEKELDEVMRLYKPYVAKADWSRVTDYRSTFLSKANRTSELARRVTERLRAFRFSLLPNEKVEYNRAPAARIIGELERLLSPD